MSILHTFLMFYIITRQMLTASRGGPEEEAVKQLNRYVAEAHTAYSQPLFFLFSIYGVSVTLLLINGDIYFKADKIIDDFWYVNQSLVCHYSSYSVVHHL